MQNQKRYKCIACDVLFREFHLQLRCRTMLSNLHLCSREEELVEAERLLAVERARLAGTRGCTVNEFESNMRDAIKKGASTNG